MVYKYKIWCITENKFIERIDEDCCPTTCPNNSSHEIDTSKTTRLTYAVNAEDPSGKQRVQQTPRPLGLLTCFTGVGDNTNDITSYGTGEDFFIQHSISDSTSQDLYLDLNIVENETWIREGYIIWKSAYFDCVTLSVVPRVTGTEIGSDTNYNFYTYNNMHIIIPAAGDGTCQITTDITSPNGGLVYIPDSDMGEHPIAFWDAEWNSTTKQYENITAAPTGNGRYNMFFQEDILNTFVNKVPLLGDGFQRLHSDDSEQIGQGMRFKTTAHTHTLNGDHDWSVACALTLYRDKTV